MVKSKVLLLLVWMMGVALPIVAQDSEKQIPQEADSIAILLQEITVDANLAERGIDKTTYLFSQQQIEQAQNGRELVSGIPNLHINEVNNTLATLNGTPFILLINGIRASDEELRVIPADKIKKVEYYDIPPIRYMNNADVVVNVHTKQLDTGWDGDVYTSVGQLYSSGSVSASYGHGPHKLTFSANLHINMKRSIKDLEQGLYTYTIADTLYKHLYQSKRMDWGPQESFSLAYTHSQENHHQLQLKASFSGYHDRMLKTKDIEFSAGSMLENNEGRLSNRTNTVSPTLSFYYDRNLNEKDKFVFNLVGSIFSNRQIVNSCESGNWGFEDNMHLKNTKRSVIGEAVYEHTSEKLNLTFGYRTNFQFLTNRLKNSLSIDERNEDINTQLHYIYGEASGRHKAWMYRLSLGANLDIKAGNEGFHHLTFIPQVMLGYRFDQYHSLRLSYRSETQMPEIQQMSTSRILVMNHFYQSGNPILVNAHHQTVRLSYSYDSGPFSLTASFYHEHRGNSLFDSYVCQGNDMSFLSTNAEKDIWRGVELSLNITPFPFLRIGADFEASHYSFKPNEQADTYRYWSFPTILYASASFKNLSASVYQHLGGSFLNGLYKEGYEKVSYISLRYRMKQISIGLQCLFPFIRDRYKNETIPTSLVRHLTDTHARTKDHAISISLSWYFHAGKARQTDNPAIDNTDYDNGVFNIK